MPNAIYNYVYYEPLAVGGPVTRQNRNPASSSTYVPIPGIIVPPTNDLAHGSQFHPDLPPPSYSDGTTTYSFGFINVSGCGAGQTSTDLGNLPGSNPNNPLLVGTETINILVVYLAGGGGGGPGGAGIYLDAFDETAGAFLDNFFVTGIAPDNSLTSNVNVYGSLAVVAATETVTAAGTPIHTPTVIDSDANFDKWEILEGTGTNPTISGTNLIVTGDTGSNLTAFAFYQQPESVYITGEYASPDIILFTPFSTTSTGTVVPNIGYDTTVIAGLPYGFAARVHNDGEYEVSAMVTFWTIPQGLATIGQYLDTQTVAVPAGGSAIVYSSVPFVNAGGADTHTCAAVSLFVPGSSLCYFNANSMSSASDMEDPDAGYPKCGSAWRNTDSITVFPKAPWHLILGLGPIEHFGPAAEITVGVAVQHVPANFMQNDRVLEIARKNKAIYGKTPAYLIPELRKELPVADIKHEITPISKGRVEQHKERGRHILHFENTRETQFKISGVVPENAKPGDIYLVQVNAHYPKNGRKPARTVGFLEALFVKGK